MNRRRAAAAVTLALVSIGGAVFVASGRDHAPTNALRVQPSRTSVGRSTTTSVPSTSTRAATTSTPVAPTSTAPVPTSVAVTSPPPTVNVSSAGTTVAATTPITQPAVHTGGGSLTALRGRTIAVDPGHNGGNYAHTTDISRPIFIGTQTRACDTTGTQTDDGYTEAAYNLDVALRLQAVLQSAGAHVVMSRTSNDGWGPCIDERAQFGNRAHADAAISIHADGGPAGGRGFHVNMPALTRGYTDDIYSASHRLGVDIRDAYTATAMPTSTYFGSQGLVERTDLGGLNLSDVPKVIVETGNMRNSTDTALLESRDFRQRAAQALAVGIARYLSGQ